MWDIQRFWQTLNEFDVIPGWREVQRMMFGATPPPPPPAIQAGVLFDFGSAASQNPTGQNPTGQNPTGQNPTSLWGAVDDVVMGGVSASGMQWVDGVARFSGTVSTSNSGGFASVRTRNFEPPLDLGGYQGLRLRVKGDGQRYKFFLRDASSWDGLAYAYPFDTKKNLWMTVTIPFDKLVPVLRARTVRDAPPLNRTQVRSLQVMLSKFEYDGDLNPRFIPGNFQLDLADISVY